MDILPVEVIATLYFAKLPAFRNTSKIARDADIT
jgi:hypothetical protein